MSEMIERVKRCISDGMSDEKLASFAMEVGAYGEDVENGEISGEPRERLLNFIASEMAWLGLVPENS